MNNSAALKNMIELYQNEARKNQEVFNQITELLSKVNDGLISYQDFVNQVSEIFGY